MEKKTWITSRFVIYIFLLIFSLIFTQALRSSSSAVLFIFMLLLPIISLLIVIIGKATVKVYVDVDNTRVEKDTEVGYEIRVINGSFIPFPFIEAHLSVPEDNGVRCIEQRMMIPLVPFGVRTIKQTVCFHYRGEYEIGVIDMRIKDPLGLFSANLAQSICHTIIVFPRMLEMTNPNENATTELPTDLTRRAVSSERSEQANIRNYIAGDSLKDIHWKLSSKVEELLVRDYNTNNNRHTYVICDLSAPRREAEAVLTAPKRKSRRERKREKTEDKVKRRNISASSEKKVSIEGANGKELSANRKKLAEQIARAAEEQEKTVEPKKGYADSPVKADIAGEIAEKNCDRVIEIAISAVLRELRSGGNVTLVYQDSREENGMTAAEYPDTVSFAADILNFATVPVSYNGKKAASLFNAIEDSQSLTVRLVTANISPADVTDYISLSQTLGGGGSDTNFELYLADTDSAYENEARHRIYSAAMKEEMGMSAIRTMRFRESIMPDGSTAFVKEDD